MNISRRNFLEGLGAAGAMGLAGCSDGICRFCCCAPKGKIALQLYSIRQYIGGVKVLGTLMEAREIINRVNADTVVVACEISPDWMKIVRKTLEPTGVKITYFSFSETEVK